MANANDSFLLYFGCWGGPGHFVFDRHKSTVRQLPPMALRGEDLDGSRVFLPSQEAPGYGRLTYLIRDGDCVTVLAWWDRTFDKRGACNAAIQCSGWETFDCLWDRFSRVYPSLAQQITKPRLCEPAGECPRLGEGSAHD